MILTKQQAQAVYSAMCALNPVGAKVTAEFRDEDLQAHQMDDGSIGVQRGRPVEMEDHNDAAAFAVAYGPSVAA